MPGGGGGADQTVHRVVCNPDVPAGLSAQGHAGGFASLRAVVVGAEKLKTRLADAFEERFGMRPLKAMGQPNWPRWPR